MVGGWVWESCLICLSCLNSNKNLSKSAIRAIVFAFEKETLHSTIITPCSTRRAEMPHELDGECVRRMILQDKVANSQAHTSSPFSPCFLLPCFMLPHEILDSYMVLRPLLILRQKSHRFPVLISIISIVFHSSSLCLQM